MDIKDFGSMIREQRQLCHHTQRSLADAVGVHFTYISKIENGKIDMLPSDDLLQNLEQELDLSKGILFAMCGKIDTKALQTKAVGDPHIARLLRVIATHEFTGEQWLKLLTIVGEVEQTQGFNEGIHDPTNHPQ